MNSGNPMPDAPSGGAARPSTGPRDVFLYLLSIVTLYFSAVAFGALLFQYVEKWFPDPLTDVFASFAQGPARWAIASLVVVFPVYVWSSWYLRRDLIRNPEKRELKTRRWLIYFTLFAAAVAIITDLVVLVFNFLGGELSPRFLGKIASVLFIAGAVFTYYLWSLKSQGSIFEHPRMRLFAWAVIGVDAVATVGGFFLIGSPFEARLARFDERRVNDLQTIQWQIVNYWQRKESLPNSLNDLRDEISGFVAPEDPESGAAYGYRILGPLQFELCADFSTASERGASSVARPIGIDETWVHGIGNVCFARTIDPELYPPFPDKTVQ